MGRMKEGWHRLAGMVFQVEKIYQGEEHFGLTRNRFKTPLSEMAM